MGGERKRDYLFIFICSGSACRKEKIFLAHKEIIESSTVRLNKEIVKKVIYSNNKNKDVYIKNLAIYIFYCIFSRDLLFQLEYIYIYLLLDAICFVQKKHISFALGRSMWILQRETQIWRENSLSFVL